MLKPHFSSATIAALGAALLFGGSTPFAKQLVGDIPPLLLAGFLYLGSGLGLGLVRLVKDRCWNFSAYVPQHISKNQQLICHI